MCDCSIVQRVTVSVVGGRGILMRSFSKVPHYIDETGSRMIIVFAQNICGLNVRSLCLLEPSMNILIREYLGQYCCKMGVKRMCTMPHCSIVAFAVSVILNTIDALLLIS